ncbi:hypothetical protein DFQ27_009878 [Actinomortierella ambigua]|uniref:Glutathione S-transferase n=1 Tax=Actinomortierella ambigua TaxID=1343610 RepID=A0A9P6PPX2_9FUNG|nr:hypothetical protein DFQ27_009878 [Actinomortierella ambigua]
MTVGKPTLYTSYICPWAQRAHVAVAETGFEVETVQIDLSKPREAWYLEINPYGQVPALKNKDDDFVILESAIVAQYIAELHPEAGLIVSDPKERAESNFLVHQFANRVQPAWVKVAYTTDKAKRAELEAEFVKQLRDFNSYLQKASHSTGKGPYTFGAKFTLADVQLGPLLSRFFLAERHQPGYKLPTKASHPELARYFEWQDALLARPSVASTTADHEVLVNHTKKFVN